MKKAIIVGSSRGLGAYLADRLVEENWEVYGVGRRPLIEIEVQKTIEYSQVDLSEATALNILSTYFKEIQPNLIIHNAVMYSNKNSSPPPLSEIETIFRVNALLPYRLFSEYLSGDHQDKFCSCIIINSDAIYHTNQHFGVYAASKAALRVFTTSLADMCRIRNASVSTLLFGPLADPKKINELKNIAERKNLSVEEVTRVFLRRSNPSFVIDKLIEFESCFQSVKYIESLGHIANGMLCKLDGGSSGSLV